MRVVIGEDEVLLREGLTRVLTRGGFEVVAGASDADGLRAAVAAERPDLVVTGIRMPPHRTDDGLLVACEIRRDRPGVAVVLLSQHVQRRYAEELLGDDPSGAGYLLKQRISDATAFCSDLRRVAAGGTVLDPEVVSLMLSRARQDEVGIDRLSARQLEVLGLMAEGRSNASIARALSISEKSVVAHASRIYDDLGLVVGVDDHRRVLAVLRYLAR